MEIKTCEQYVLAKLKEAETQVDALTDRIQIQGAEISALRAELNDLKALIRRRCSLDVSTEGHNLVSVDEPWEKYDPVDYNMIADLLKEEV